MEENNVDSTKTPQTALKLTSRQLKSLPFFLESASIEETCRRASLSQTTFYRWAANPNFKAALEEAKGRLYSDSFEKLKLSFSKATDVLIALMEDEQVWVKLRSAERILETGFRLKELEEIESRLAQVERVIFEKRIYR